MIESLIKGETVSRFLLIKDNVCQSGYNLLKAFLKLHVCRNDVHLLCYEWSPEEIVSEMALTSSNLKIYDGISDPLGWENGSSSLQITYNLFDTLNLISTTKDSVVVLDLLTVVLLHQPVQHVYKALYSMLYSPNKTVKQVIAVVHSDIHDEETLNHLESLATSILQVSVLEDKYSLCSALHKSPGGKVIQETVKWRVTENYDLQDVCLFNETLPKLPSAQPDLLTNLTFNVTLKNDEKEARDQLILPYTRCLHSTAECDDGGLIYYQMDEVDDFDEDDPDDDLNI